MSATTEKQLTIGAAGPTVALADPSSPESLALLQHLWEELDQLYSDANLGQYTAAAVQGVGSAFVVARLNGQAVGCGAIRPFKPGVAEVKRMYVEPAARRQGISRRILAKLENIAQESGYVALILETGLKQPEAIALYSSSGYQRVECYESYAHDPLSICFEKRLV